MKSLWTLFSLFILSFTLLPTTVRAIDAIQPESLCDRFVNPVEHKNCFLKLKKQDPDSYLSAICQKQFEDELFWKCLEKGRNFSFDPRKIDSCSSDTLNDKQRIDCIQKIIYETSSFSKTGHQNFTIERKPASRK